MKRLDSMEPFPGAVVDMQQNVPPAGHERWRPRHGRRAGLATLLLLLAVVIAGCSLGTSPNTSQAGAAPTVVVPPAAQDLQQTVINVIRTVQPSVVQVTSTGSQGRGIGSGDIVSNDGYIVTNDHVVAGFSSYTVSLAGGAQPYSARLVGASAQDDLAVLKINASGLRPINFADSAKVQVGEFCLALGSPLGLQQSATQGIVSALNRTASEAPNGPAGVLIGLIQTSAPINPGNSGGALVNLQGELIGIPTLGVVDPNSGSAAPGIGFAIPSNRVKFVTDQLIKYGRLVNTGQGFIGIQGEDITPDLANAYNLPVQSGVLVAGFANDATGSSPAQRAGMQQGDIIVSVNGTAINNSGDLAAALESKSPGTKVTLTVVRGTSKQQMTVTLGQRPVSGG
jgi:putative serine protease PepD